MAFRASVEAEKWARKDEADYAVSLSHRLGFRGELNNGTFSCMFGLKPWTPVDSALQLLTQYSPRQVVESRVESVLWQENGRVHRWRHKYSIISLIRGCQLTIHEERQAQFSIENCAASIAADYSASLRHGQLINSALNAKCE